MAYPIIITCWICQSSARNKSIHKSWLCMLGSREATIQNLGFPLHCIKRYIQHKMNAIYDFLDSLCIKRVIIFYSNHWIAGREYNVTQQYVKHRPGNSKLVFSWNPMSLYTFFGCLLVAYSPILSIFFLYIGRNAQHVLLMVARWKAQCVQVNDAVLTIDWCVVPSSALLPCWYQALYGTLQRQPNPFMLWA